METLVVAIVVNLRLNFKIEEARAKVDALTELLELLREMWCGATGTIWKR